MKELELLAPAKNADIGIAAIDCGADAVYIAGPLFGARQAAGNGIDEIARLCTHAHRYGARVFVTVNTIIFEDELPAARKLIREVVDAGADALIVQDLAVLQIMEDLVAEGMRRIPLHASTQTAILSPERASFLAGLGFARLIPERALSLEEIRGIAAAAPGCEIEFFVHGALCVCYSGQCYLSEAIAGRSANRGACIQACRSRYDLVDQDGKVLVKDKALLSLKDLRLADRLEDLVRAGVSSFKIEGRLKNESYVRNVVREYSLALDNLVMSHPQEYCRASFGRVAKCFSPALDKTFNRGYTEFRIAETREGAARGWASMDAAKGMGEKIGKVISVRHDPRRGTSSIGLECPNGCVLSNGDGFSFVAGNGEVIGFRGDVCSSSGRQASITCKSCGQLYKGAQIWRNYDSAFEKEIARNKGTREMRATLSIRVDMDEVTVSALSEDGREWRGKFVTAATEAASNEERLEEMFRTQLAKASGIWRMEVADMNFRSHPLVSSAFINSIRRTVALELDAMPAKQRPLAAGHPYAPTEGGEPVGASLDYRANIANSIARNIYLQAGARVVAPAYEIAHPSGVQLLRSRYCIRHDLGICLREHPDSRRLFLLNNGRRLALHFDCANCEMSVHDI